MYREILQNVDGIAIFPAVSLVLFVVVFMLAVLHAFRLDGAGVRRLAAMPLEPLESDREDERSR
jgi:hypothetical protein